MTSTIGEVEMAHPVIHWAIGGSDSEKLQGFYARLFGWKIGPAGDGYWLVAPGPSGGIGGGIMEVHGDVPAHVTIYVQAEDLDETLARAAELGGRVVKPPTPTPGVGSFALFEDPSGNVVGVMKTTER